MVVINDNMVTFIFYYVFVYMFVYTCTHQFKT